MFINHRIICHLLQYSYRFTYFVLLVFISSIVKNNMKIIGFQSICDLIHAMEIQEQACSYILSHCILSYKTIRAFDIHQGLQHSSGKIHSEIMAHAGLSSVTKIRSIRVTNCTLCRVMTHLNQTLK